MGGRCLHRVSRGEERGGEGRGGEGRGGEGIGRGVEWSGGEGRGGGRVHRRIRVNKMYNIHDIVNVPSYLKFVYIQYSGHYWWVWANFRS